MLQKFSTAIFAVLMLFVLQSCATRESIPDLPSVLVGDEGILVARLYVIGMAGMENASIDIDGVLRASSLRDGYIAITLKAGDHKFNQIRAAGQLLGSNSVQEVSPIRQVKGGGGSAPIFIYVPGSSYTVYYTTLAVDRTFHIEPGQVTNLGLVVYMPVPDDPSTKSATANKSRQFRVVAVDNSTEIKSFLDTNYPDLVGTLKNHDISLAPTNYLDAKRLPDLRRAIAYYESRGPHVLSSATKTVVYGRAGTIVALDKRSPVDKPAVEVLDTGTVADIIGATHDDEKFSFVTSDAKLLSWDGSKLTQAPMPYHVHPVVMNALGENGLVVVDNRMRILTYQYSDGRWSNYEGGIIKTARDDINVTPDDQGAYISLGSRGVPDAMYYLKAENSVPQLIAKPENRIGVSSADSRALVARDAGLFVIFDKPAFYFWSKANQRWEYYSKPTGKCKAMSVDNEGRALSIECDGINYHSSDSGASWVKQEV